MATTWHGLAANWFALWISAWMAAVYAERIVLDVMIRMGKSLVESLTSGLVVVFFFIEWLLVFCAFKLEEEDIPRFKAWLRRVMHDYRGGLWSLAIFLSIAVFVFGKTFLRDPLGPIAVLAKRWLVNLWQEVVGDFFKALPGLIIVVVLYSFYKLIARLFRRQDPVYIAFREWTLSLIPIFLGLSLYVAVYGFWILSPIPDAETRSDAWIELIKDGLIYTLVAVVLIQGLYRYRQCCDEFKDPYAKWWGFVVLAGGTAVVASLALYADLRGLDEMARFGSVQYPDKATHSLVRKHVLVRDWVMLVPLIFAMFVWLAGDMCSAWDVFKRKATVANRK